MGRPHDGSVTELQKNQEYLLGNSALVYLEPGRGIVGAYYNGFGRARYRILGNIYEGKLPITNPHSPAWLVEYSERGRYANFLPEDHDALSAFNRHLVETNPILKGI